MERIVVVGGPGNGKSTLAARLADRLDLVHVELDGLFHKPGWESASPEEFRAALATALDAAPDGWVSCGNYIDASAEIHIDVADTVIWLDLPRAMVTWRAARRTLRRALTREPLFGQNITEPLTNFYRWDPNKNVIRWAWVHHPKYAELFRRKLADPRWDHLDVHHLQTPHAVAQFLAEVTVADR